MKPPRGLSMSEIRKNAMDTATGTMRKMRRSVRLCTVPDQDVATEGDSHHQAPTPRLECGSTMRACVYPCEFSTSFMPETTRAREVLVAPPLLAGPKTTARSVVQPYPR